MAVPEIKNEILKVLDTFPDDVLSEVLKFLKSVKGKSLHTIGLSQSFKKILEEDKELLEKLAK